MPISIRPVLATVLAAAAVAAAVAVTNADTLAPPAEALPIHYKGF
jgi:hypothetical protein